MPAANPAAKAKAAAEKKEAEKKPAAAGAAVAGAAAGVAVSAKRVAEVDDEAEDAKRLRGQPTAPAWGHTQS